VDDKYSKYANFKTRILLKAQEDLKSTDIGFTFEEISESSRRVEKIAFYIHKNNPEQKNESQLEDDSSVEFNESGRENLLDRIRGLGITQRVIQNEIIPNYDQ